MEGEREEWKEREWVRRREGGKVRGLKESTGVYSGGKGINERELYVLFAYFILFILFFILFFLFCWWVMVGIICLSIYLCIYFFLVSFLVSGFTFFF